METKPQPFLLYSLTTSSRSLPLEQSYAGIQPTTSRKSNQRLTSGTNSLFTLGFASVFSVMYSPSLYIPGTIVGSFVEEGARGMCWRNEDNRDPRSWMGTGRVGYLSAQLLSPKKKGCQATPRGGAKCDLMPCLRKGDNFRPEDTRMGRFFT